MDSELPKAKKGKRKVNVPLKESVEVVERVEPKSDMQALMFAIMDIFAKNKIPVNTTEGNRVEIKKAFIDCEANLPELVSLNGYYNFSIKLRCSVDRGNKAVNQLVDLRALVWGILRNENVAIGKYTVTFEGNFPQNDKVDDAAKVSDVIYMLKQKRS